MPFMSGWDFDIRAGACKLIQLGRTVPPNAEDEIRHQVHTPFCETAGMKERKKLAFIRQESIAAPITPAREPRTASLISGIG